MRENSRAARRIDFEAHFVTVSYVRAMEESSGYPCYLLDEQTGTCRLCYAKHVSEPLGDALLDRLLDVGEQRLTQMDAAGIDVQILSLFFNKVFETPENVDRVLRFLDEHLK